MANAYGDVELDTPGIRALAHPIRLRILFRLREHGPATATGLSAEVDASPSVVSWHLRHLAKHRLVVDAPELGRGRERYWQAAGSGFRYAVTDEPSRVAANALQALLDAEAGDVVGDWHRDTEPRLEPQWRELAGTQDTTVSLTVDELAAVNRAVEELLAPYVRRSGKPDARPVRIVRHTLPAGPDA